MAMTCIVASLLCTDVHVFYFVWQNCMCIHFGTIFLLNHQPPLLLNYQGLPIEQVYTYVDVT